MYLGEQEIYRVCGKLIEESRIRGKGHAIYEGTFPEIEKEIEELCDKKLDEIDTVIEETVTAKAQSGDIEEMASLFNSVSFRDFVMTGYKNRCAITGNVIRYGSFMNLEAAHIWPRSHKGLYLPRDFYCAIVSEDDYQLVKDVKVQEIGHCAIGYVAAPANAPAPRKDNYVYYVR